MADDREMALDYHRFPTPGKISVTPTTALATQRDLSLAYSPGVAEACMLIVEDENEAVQMTIRANLVGVITNGTAVLGLGSIGPLAAKPVMEGKGVLFKKFGGIDVFDIEVDETDPDKLVEIVAGLEPTFGGINLEDIKAPECFTVEQKLRERLAIPVFHDDQHGTAIVVSAAVYNGLRVVDKKIGEVRLVCSGAGAAALACLNLLVSLGLDPENVLVVDRHGVIYEGREENLDPYKAQWARKTEARDLGDAMKGADIFLGLSAADVVSADMVKSMAEGPDPHGARQPQSGNQTRARTRGAARLHHRHRPLGLSQPGQQRAVLPLHLPRRARCRRDDDQRRDEARVRARARRSRRGRGLGHRRQRLWRSVAVVWTRVPDPQAVRSPSDRRGGAGGRQGGDGKRGG